MLTRVFGGVSSACHGNFGCAGFIREGQGSGPCFQACSEGIRDLPASMPQTLMLRHVVHLTSDAQILGSPQMSPTQTVSREVFEVFPTVAPSTPEPATARRAGEPPLRCSQS